MPKKMDVSEVVSKLQAQRDEIDAALRALTRVAYQTFPTTTHVKRTSAPTPTTPKKKRRSRTPAERAAMAKKMKAIWAKRKAAAKKS